MSRSALCSLYGYGRVWGINRDTIIRSTIRTEQDYGRMWGIRQDTMRGRGLLACQDDSLAAIPCPSLCLVLSPTPCHSPVQSVSCSGLSCLGLSLMPFHNHIKSIMRSGTLCLIILLLTVKLSKCSDRYTGGADVAIEKSLINTLYKFTGQQ